MRAFRIKQLIIVLAGVIVLAVAYIFGMNRYILAVMGLLLVGLAAADLQLERSVLRPLEELEKSLQMQPEDTEKTLLRVAGNRVSEQTGKIISACVDRRVSTSNEEMFTRQTQLTALQSQINPHFLYNTLDTIRGRAIIDDNRDVASMIETLSSFFRYSISRKGNKVTLRDELKNIQNYMSIMRYRFGDRYHHEIEIDDEDEWILDSYVPRLILQPIVENAVIHGLEDKLTDGCVTIDVTVADDLIITVSDNGAGMSIGQLDQLNTSIRSSETDPASEEEDLIKNNTGIGLPNIHKRIELLYGDRYGLHVYSSIGQGTDVEIILPIDNREE